MQLDKMGENGGASFPGSEMLGEQKLIAKVHRKGSKSLSARYLKEELQVL